MRATSRLCKGGYSPSIEVNGREKLLNGSVQRNRVAVIPALVDKPRRCLDV